MAGARRGICSSPLSSDDEAANPSLQSFPEISPSPAAPQKKARKFVRKRTPKAKRTILQNKKQKLSTRPSTKELVQCAPQKFVEYLADQLSIAQQTRYEAEFGGERGYIVKLPVSSGKLVRKRSELEDWIRSLGFLFHSPSNHYMLRISNLKADVILSELKHRVPLPANATHPTLLRMTQYYKELDTQKIDCTSPSTIRRSLSSTQHRMIADAMEVMLAQPSVRKDRRIARRLSKLERISGRLLHSIAKAPSAMSFSNSRTDSMEQDCEIDKALVYRRFSRDKVSCVQKSSVLSQSVVEIVLYSGLVDVRASQETLRQVSTMWEKVVVMAYAWTITNYTETGDFYTTEQLYKHHPHGQYLADGAFKEVFKVFSLEQDRFEAVSVMDISDIANQSVIRQEVAHSILLSDATERGICPNFLQVFDIFLAHERPSPNLWGSKEHRKPMELLANGSIDCETQTEQKSASNKRDHIFQYMRMEYCDGGDLEDFISLQENQNLPLHSVAIPFFFQMVFGLYCARERFHLRHGDIKLLNFFLKDIGRSEKMKDPGSDVVLHYMVESACFVLQMPASFSYWVKLADYGAADSNLESLGKAVTADHFTTLENSPVEYMLEGDAAVLSYASDTFSLGLCLLHLLSGRAPYEEILEDVKCPKDLLKDLKAVWMSSRKNSGFSVIKSVASGDDENTLCHTLYRYIVLFGLPEEKPSKSDKVWQLLLKHLRPEDKAINRPQRRRRQLQGSTNVMTTEDQFLHDQSLYSIAHGTNEAIFRCRERLKKVPGAINLLMSLVDFDPSKRLTLKQVMYHPALSTLRLPTPASADYVICYYGSRGQDGRSLADV
ncbi:serine threonine protein kinase [Plasmopara halstedii]|uniref:Serine threonine protein kinase n=1 Tax=Plasmopara halstedii TaxID=4781 RepID=A0A0P1B3A0_PLAHL|nr:serine threonine protein kinase [Plasmopara halstedii]CEG48546.1 serine threonine protein kinase [Plasmopara halstedii]|eukprot:XP_024584915.1 serine threonine protein kinase [Plasmopara halstedii]